MNLIPVCEMENKYKGCSLVIAGCGTSYNQLPFDNFTEVFGDDCYVFAANAAITRHFENPNHFWLCNDVERILRFREFHDFSRGYRKWKLVTRKCLLPGKEGDVDWRNASNRRMRIPFHWRIPNVHMKKSTVYYYNDFPNMEAHCPHFEGVVEMGLWLAKRWGFEKVLLVGVDLHETYRGQYAKLWSWKPHKDREDKFANMRKALVYRRPEFPDKIIHCSLPFRDIMGKCEYEYVPPSKVKSFAEM